MFATLGHGDLKIASAMIAPGQARAAIDRGRHGSLANTSQMVTGSTRRGVRSLRCRCQVHVLGQCGGIPIATFALHGVARETRKRDGGLVGTRGKASGAQT